MHALDCGGDVEGDGRRNIEQRRAFEDEEGAEPLASAEDGLAHGAPQPRRHGGAGGIEDLGEPRVRLPGAVGQPLREAHDRLT
jgi:hypothetical protein